MPVVVDSRNEGGSSSNAAGDVVVSKIKSSSKTNRSELVVESKKKAVKRCSLKIKNASTLLKFGLTFLGKNAYFRVNKTTLTAKIHGGG